MRSRRVFSLAVSPLIVGLLSSCGYIHVGRLPAPASAPVLVAEGQLAEENSNLRLEKKMLQQELALTRAQGDALRRAIENRAADGDTSQRLTEQLTAASRELATLRSTYADLQASREAAVSAAAAATAETQSLRDRLAVSEEKLAVSQRDSVALQQEIAQLRHEVDRTRAENLALGDQVKSLTSQNAAALAAIAALNTDLLAQKDARFRAEQDAQTLRTHLQTASPTDSVLAQQRTGAAAEARSLAAEHAAEIASLKEELDASRHQLASLESERATLQQSLAALESTAESNSVLRDENLQLKTASAQLHATKAQLEDQLARLKNGSSAEQVKVLREQLRTAQTRAAALADENSRLKSRVAISLTQTSPEAVTSAEPAPADISTPTVTESVAASDTESPILAPIEETRSAVTATLITRAPGSPRQPASRIELPGRGRVHVVAGGDTLSRISARYYGTPSRWTDILAANRDILGETNHLVIGRALRIP